MVLPDDERQVGFYVKWQNNPECFRRELRKNITINVTEKKTEEFVKFCFQKIGGYCVSPFGGVSETPVLELLMTYAPLRAGGSPHLHASPPVCDGFLRLRKYFQFNIFYHFHLLNI